MRWVARTHVPALVIAMLGGLACGRIGYEPLDGSMRRDAGGGSAPIACAARTTGTVYYVAATGGSDTASGRTRTEPWATFAHAWSALGPGDTLVLLDGTYTEQMLVSISGVEGNEIRICSDTDGGAIIDGSGTWVPCQLGGSETTPVTHITLDGVACRGSNSQSVVVQNANHVVLRRVSAYGSTDVASASLFVYQVQDALLEDVAAYGSGGSALYLISTSRVTVRRAWARWVSSATFYNSAIQVSDGGDNVVENCVATAGPSPTQYVGGIQFYVASRNVARGSIARTEPGSELDVAFSASARTEQTEGNRMLDTVAIGATLGLFQRSDRDLVLQRMTFAGTMNENLWCLPNSEEPKPAGFMLGTRLTDSVFLRGSNGIEIGETLYPSTVTHSHNDLFGITTPYSGTTADPSELAIDPDYDVARYGDGAYLIAPRVLATAGEGGGRMGAEVLYRTVDGVVTNEPLWPWPMEDRIMRETGRSVTWAAGGGLWTTLDGVYP